MSVNNKLFEKGDYGVAGDTEARTQMKGANPDIMDKGDNGFQKLDYGGGSTSSTPTAPVAVKDPTPKPKPKPKAADPKPEPEATPETGGDPKLGLAGIPWKEIAIVAGAAALIAALVALFKGASRSIKLRYNKAVKTLARMQKDFTMNKEGLDMRAVLPGIGSRLNDFFTRVLSGSAFNNNEQKGVMDRKSSRKYKDGVIGLYPFCGRIEEDIDNDFNMAQTVFSKIKLSADQQASSDDTKHTDESYNGKPVYKSFREAFNAGQLYESADGKPLNESFTVMTLAALASATVRGGMFIASKYKANKNGDMEKVKGGETAVQVTEESTREMCYAIMNAFFEKYISFEEVTKKMGIDVKGLSDIDNSTIDKFSQLLKAYSNPDSGAMTKQYGKIKTQYKKMCNHYFNIGIGVISNFKKYTKAEDEKHENLLIAANEKLNAMWDEQKDKYNDLFPYVLNEIIGHSHYQDYIDFIIEDVIPVFRTGIAGDADYMLDVMPKKGDLFLLKQTAHGKVNVNGNKVDIGNMAIVEITKSYSPEHKNLEMRFIGLYKSKTVDPYPDGSVSLICHDSTVDKTAYSTKPVLITYQKFMALDPHIIANANDFIIAKPTVMPKRAAEKKQEYFIPNDVINSIPALKSMISNLATQMSSISSRQDQMNGAIIKITDVLGKDGEKLKADIVALVTDKIQVEKKDTGDDTIVEPIKIEQPTPDSKDTEKPIIIIKNEINVTSDDGEKKDEGNAIHSVEIPVAELKEAEPEIIPVEPVEETAQSQDKEETGNDYMRSHWIGKKDNLTLCVIPYAQENNVTKFAVRMQKDKETKNLNVAINGDVDWDKINTELKSQYGLELSKNDVNNGRQIGIEKTIKHISTEELQTVDNTDEFIKFINDLVNGESSEETIDYYNNYWTWNKRDSEASSSLTMVLYRNKNNGEATRFACILTKDGEKKYFNIAVRDGVEWSAFNKELESIGMKRVDSAEDVVNQTIDEVERNKPELRSVADATECFSLINEITGNKDEKKDSEEQSDNNSQIGSYIKLNDEHFVAILPYKNEKGEPQGIKCSYNDSKGNKITIGNFTFKGAIFKNKEIKQANEIIAELKKDRTISIGEQKYTMQFIPDVSSIDNEALKTAFVTLGKNDNEFDNENTGVKGNSKIDSIDGMLDVISRFITGSINYINAEEDKKNILNILTKNCVEIINSIKVKPVNNKANTAKQADSVKQAGTNTVQQDSTDLDNGNDSDNSEPINSSLEEGMIDRSKNHTAVIEISNTKIADNSISLNFVNTNTAHDILSITFESMILEERPLAVWVKFDIIDNNEARAIVCLPDKSKKEKDCISFTINVNDTSEKKGENLAASIKKLAEPNDIKLKPQDEPQQNPDLKEPKKEALNDSIRESIKFNVSYEANDKIIESAAYNTGITRRISSDKDVSKYYVISECMWSCANDADTKKSLVLKLTSAIKKDPTKYGLMEYAKANDNVEFSRNFADMSYSVKKPGNLHSIVGCSLFECAIAVKFNGHDNISNAIAIGVNKIY